MIGQTKLLNKLNNYSLATLPHTLLFLGEDGCGKHTVANMIANKFNMQIAVIDGNITGDDIIEFQQSVSKRIYLIDLAIFTEKQQNQFLKFIEQPSDTAYIILIGASESGILPTILNRCIKYYFEPYTTDELKQVVTYTNELIYDICRTPGRLLLTNDENINALYNLCTTIVNKINNATYANTISIATKINYKEDYDKFGFIEFFNMLKYVSFNSYLKTNNKLSYKIYEYTADYYQQLINKVIAKEAFMIGFLNGLWELTH